MTSTSILPKRPFRLPSESSWLQSGTNSPDKSRLHSSVNGKKDLVTITDIEHPLYVKLGPSLDFFFGYRDIDGQLKLLRRREKSPDLKHGYLYSQCTSFVFRSQTRSFRIYNYLFLTQMQGCHDKHHTTSSNYG